LIIRYRVSYSFIFTIGRHRIHND